jgi:hypothetical protein
LRIWIESDGFGRAAPKVSRTNVNLSTPKIAVRGIVGYDIKQKNKNKKKNNKG